MRLGFATAFVALVFGAGAARPECAVDDDCYGGKCRGGACACPPLWTGPQCQVMKLKPVDINATGLMLNKVSTWGGAAVEDDDGVWHMFAAQMMRNCGLTAWAPNSEIVHATSTTGPSGPYKPMEKPVLPNFAHGPKITRLPDGTFAMPHIGCGDGSSEPYKCTNGTTPPDFVKNMTHSMCNVPGWTGWLTAESVQGPWAQQADPSSRGVTIKPVEGSWHKTDSGITNPSIYQFPNGTTLLAYSTGCTGPNGCDVDEGHKHVGLAVGSLQGGFDDLAPFEPMWPEANEDPCIFFDPDSGMWHIVSHRTSEDPAYGGGWVAQHAVARSWTGPWKKATVPPYPWATQYRLPDGTVVEAKKNIKRERPQVIYNRQGRIIGLSNGVMPGADSPLPNAGGDWTYTHVQLFDL